MANRIARAIGEAATDATIFTAINLALRKFVTSASNEAVKEVGAMAGRQLKQLDQARVRRQLFFDLQAILFEEEINLLYLLKQALANHHENRLVDTLGQIYPAPPEQMKSRVGVLKKLNEELPDTPDGAIKPHEKSGILLEVLNNDGAQQEIQNLLSAASNFFKTITDGARQHAPEVKEHLQDAGETLDSAANSLTDWLRRNGGK